LRTTANGALWLGGSIISGGGNPTVAVDGGGSTTKFVGLLGDNSTTFTGNIIITNKGDLKAGNTNALSAANAVSLDSTSLFDNGSRNLTIAGLNDYAGVGGTVADAGSGNMLTLGGSGICSFSGVINNIGGIIKAGSGQETFAGANTYTGPTVVSNGTLVVNGSLAAGAVTVAGGTLAGSGTLNGATTVQGGTLSPGVSGIGTLAISNSLTLQAGGTLAVDINKTTGAADQIVGLTAVTYGGALAVNNLAGSLTTTDAFKLFNAGSYAGAFAAITPATPGAGLVWNTNTLTTDGTLRVASASAPLSWLAFTAGPVISGTSLTISGTNSGAGTVYLLTSTNLAAPLNTWTPIWTNVLTATGTFTTNLLNTVNPALKQQFYLLSNTNN
jgi:autotransporter-associated beta strand protein